MLLNWLKLSQLFFSKEVKNSQDWKHGFDCRTLQFCLTSFSETQLFGTMISTVTNIHGG